MIAQKYKDKLNEIKENVRESSLYFQENAKRFHKMRSFLFQSNLSGSDKDKLDEMDKPAIEFNVLEAYVSRLRGEFSKQEPSISVHGSPMGDTAPELVTTLEGHFRYILMDAKKRSFEYDTYTDGLSGGYSVFKIWTEYESERSFNQVIKIGRVFDPTLTGFDPLAREPHKGDGNYSWEQFPKTLVDLKLKYPDADFSKLNFDNASGEFSWSYTLGGKKIVLLTDYYEKKKKKVKIYQLANNQTMTAAKYEKMLEQYAQTQTLIQPPAIVNERMAEDQTICRYVFMGSEVLEYEETIFKYLPHIFYDGNSIRLRQSDAGGQIKQFSRPYFYNAIGMQRLKNLAGQTIANQIENMVTHKYIVEKHTIPTQYLDAWLKPQQTSTLIWDAYKKDGTQFPPPREVVHPPIPQEITTAFMTAEQNIQSMLGSYDAALGINNNQLSGVAIVEGATQSNAAAMPYVVNLLCSLTQAGTVILDLVPKLYKTPRTIPVIDAEGKNSYIMVNLPPQPGQPPINLNYDPSQMNVMVSAGVNYEIQQNASVQTLATLGQAFPGIGAFVNTVAMPYIFENLQLYRGDALVEESKKWIEAQQQSQQQAQQNNPAMIALNMKKQQMAQDAQLKTRSLDIEQEKLQTDKFESIIKFFSAHQDQLLQMMKIDAERTKNATTYAMAKMDQDHNHAKDIISTINTLAQSPSPVYQ